MTEINNLPSLDERIMAFVDEKAIFTIKDLQQIFPEEPSKNIYRAVAKLENESKIRFIKYQSKRKVYTTEGVSKLPGIKVKGERRTLMDLFKQLPVIYEDGHYSGAKELNSLPLNYGKLFLVAQIEDPKERKTAFLSLHRDIMSQRATLITMLENLDSVINHPSMAGDMEFFAQVLNGNEGPNPQETIEFKRWFNKLGGQ